MLSTASGSSESAGFGPDARGGDAGRLTRLGAAGLLALAAIEVAAICWTFSFDFLLEEQSVFSSLLLMLKQSLPLTLSFAGATVVIGLGRPGVFAHIFREPRAPWARGTWLGVHFLGLALFCGVLALTQLFAVQLPIGATIAALWAGAGLGLVGWLLTLASAAAWRTLIAGNIALFVAATVAALGSVLLGYAAQEYWLLFSQATFSLVEPMLRLALPVVVSRPDELVIGAPNFLVEIHRQCSGYEGVGLVVGFSALFLYLLRNELRFPHALLLPVIGVVVMWLSNSVRIAVLVYIGATRSPELAIGGFHSTAGWALFLLVAVGLMAAGVHTPYFRKRAAVVEPVAMTPERKARLRLADSMLMPFLTLMLCGVAINMISSDPNALYPAKVVITAVCVGLFLSVYRSLDWRLSFEAVAIGVLVAVFWIAMAPEAEGAAGSELAVWLAGLSDEMFIFWVAMRGLGSTLLVPLAEELVFRGYLHRKLINDDFEKVEEGAFAWRAFIVTTVLFAALHSRWFEAAIAGALYALVLYRTGRLSNAIIAHAITNGLIFAFALATGSWNVF